MRRGDPGWADHVALARRRLAAFARVCREEFVEEWYHARVLGPALDGIVRHARGYGDGWRRLVLEVPQQEGKTLFTCLMSAQILGQAPGLHVQDIGYGDEFIRQCSAYVSEIGSSDGFRDAYPDVSLGRPEVVRGGRRGDEAVDRKASDTAHQIDTLVRTPRGWRRAGGSFRARSVKGPVGGRPGQVMILEDPYKGWDGDAGALSPAWNRHLRNFYGAVFKTRQRDLTSCEVLAFTPFTDDDIRMDVIDRWCRSGGPFLWLKLPSRQRPDQDVERAALLGRDAALRGLARFLGVEPAALRASVEAGGPLRPYDTRPPGACLSPTRRGQAFVDMLYAEATPRDLAALLDLCPRSDLVDRFPSHLFVPWDPAVTPLSDMSTFVAACDPNGDATKEGSFAAVGVWGIRPRPDRGAGRYPHHVHRCAERRDRPGYTDFCDMLAGTLREWPEVETLRVERAGHGRSLATDRTFAGRPEIRRVKLVFSEPRDSKSSRWTDIEVPLVQRCMFVPTAPSPCGRVDPRWVHDKPDAGVDETSDGRALGYLGEMRGAGRIPYNDRVDETGLLIEHLAEDAQVDDDIETIARLRIPGWSM